MDVELEVVVLPVSDVSRAMLVTDDLRAARAELDMWFPDDVQRLRALSTLVGRLLIRSTPRTVVQRAPTTAGTPPAGAVARTPGHREDAAQRLCRLRL